MLSDDRPTDPAWLPIFSKEEHFMGNAFGMIPGLEPDEWSNDACRGYVIMAMENCGLDVYKRQVQQDGFVGMQYLIFKIRSSNFQFRHENDSFRLDIVSFCFSASKYSGS